MELRNTARPGPPGTRDRVRSRSDGPRNDCARPPLLPPSDGIRAAWWGREWAHHGPHHGFCVLFVTVVGVWWWVVWWGPEGFLKVSNHPF
ncbi:hypothetical protein BX283_0055 [Streptomyces sp. TLI_146]|nr:hypothetical protein BX283_0055 [Streptomyces sp. TLI_146]